MTQSTEWEILAEAIRRCIDDLKEFTKIIDDIVYPKEKP